MGPSYKFLRVSVVVFKVLAWLALAVQSITGLMLIITGGEPVVVGGVDIPARVVGVLNFVAAGLYFYSMWLISSLVKLWLDIRENLPSRSVGA